MPLLLLPPPSATSNTFPTSAGVLGCRWAVEISFTTGPKDTPVWVDITEKVLSISTDRGRQRQLDRFETGRAGVVLDNSDRRFDPTYTSGPYYGYLLPMRRIRIRAQYDNVTYPRFDGYVENWAQSYDISDNMATCTVTAADAFKIFGLVKPTSPFALQVASETPDVWYRCSEGDGTVLYDGSGNARDGTINSGGVTYGTAGLISSDTNRCLDFDGASGYAASSTVPDYAAELCIEAWFSTSASVAQTIFSYGGPSGSGALLRVSLNPSGQLEFHLCVPGAAVTTTQTTTGTPYNDGLPHHVAIDVQIALPFTNWAYAADGVLYPAVTGSSTAVIATPARTLYVGQTGVGTEFFGGQIDEVVTYVDRTFPEVVNTIYIALAHHDYGAAPFAGEDTGTQYDRVLDAIGWPDTERDISTGQSTAQAIDYAGASASNYLDALQSTEQGRAFITQDGKAKFDDRYSTIGAASVATFSDADPDVRYRDVQFSYDEILIRNAVTAQRVGGGQITVSDATSIGQYYERTYEANGLLYEDDNQTRDFAQWVLNKYKDPALRVAELTVLPNANPTVNFPAVLALELGDLATVKRTPLGIGNQIDVDVIIEGIREIVDPHGPYSVTLRIAEADTASYWILGDSTYGLLGSTTRLAF